MFNFEISLKDGRSIYAYHKLALEVFFILKTKNFTLSIKVFMVERKNLFICIIFIYLFFLIHSFK